MLMRMNKDNIIEFSKDDITFYGDTKEEKEKNEMMFDLTMENDRLHQELDKYKNVIDKIKEYVKENSIYYNTSDGCQWVDQFKILDKIDELLEEVE